MPDNNKRKIEEIIEILRKKLAEEKKKVEIMNKSVNILSSAKEELSQKNEKLIHALNEAKAELVLCKQEIEKLTAPPNLYAFVVRVVDLEKRTVDIIFENKAGFQLVTASLGVNINELKFGTHVRLNENLAIIAIDNSLSLIGSEVYFDCWIDKNRLRATEPVGDEKIIVFAADSLPRDLDVGDALRFYGGFAFEKLPKTDSEEYFLTEIPKVSFEDIGALDEQIQTIKDELELPFLYPEIFTQYETPLPKGILLYGPPGCGKTMIAQAIARNISQRASERSGASISKNFINIKGPELLNKYVGETERKIREIFQIAKKAASGEFPVIIYFDEIDSFFRARGLGISSDTESTIVPTLCSELEGLVRVKNIIVIGSTNRQDLIDPAVLRPGRFDIKMKIERPKNKQEAKQIFLKKLKTTYKLHQKYDKLPNALDYIIDETLESIFSKADEIRYKDNEGREQIRDNKYLEVTYINNKTEILYYADLILSGSLIENVVNRAKKMAAKMEIEKKEIGLRARYLCAAVQKEYDENEDLPNTTNPDEWSKILGIKEKIVSIRFIRKYKKEEQKKIETVQTGHYL